MIMKITSGPMAGAVYVLSKDRPEQSTCRKPDGLVFYGFDDNLVGRPYSDEYLYDKLDDQNNHMVLCYAYANRRYLTADEAAYRDLAQSGGIVDAP